MIHIIVGVDCGKTSAIACLNLDGKLIYIAHKMFAGQEWIINKINEIGTPSIIATDRRNPGKVIKKINAAFNARLFYPEKDISIEEKRIIAKNKEIKNHHEQDAYSAAIKAYNNYSNKLKQVSHMISKPEIDADSIKAKVIKKVSVKEALLNKKVNRR